MQRFGPYRVGETVGRGSMASVKMAVHEKTGTQVALKIIPRKTIEAQAQRHNPRHGERDVRTGVSPPPPPPAPPSSSATTTAAASTVVDGSGDQATSSAGNASSHNNKTNMDTRHTTVKPLTTNAVAAKIALEVGVLRKLKHPHIIRLYDVVFTAADVVLVLEFAAGGELFDHLNSFGRLPEAQARTLFHQLLSALEYLHTNRVAHRDLKPENIVLDKAGANVKITDFDLAGSIMDGQMFDVSCGTPNYAAPEVVTGQLYTGPEADLWSLGVTLFAMLTGRLPFDDENVHSLFRKIKDGAFTVPASVSAGARDLLTRLLVVDPLQRMTVSQVFAHPWVRMSLPRYIVDIHDSCVQQHNSLGEQPGDSTSLVSPPTTTQSTGTASATSRGHPSSWAPARSNASSSSPTKPYMPSASLASPPQPTATRGPPSRHATTSVEDLAAQEDDAFVAPSNSTAQRRQSAERSPTPNVAKAGGRASSNNSTASTNGPTRPASAVVADMVSPAVQQPQLSADGGPVPFRAAHPVHTRLRLDPSTTSALASLFQLSLDEAEEAIARGLVRRESEQRTQLHVLVHGVAPRQPLVFDKILPDPVDRRQVSLDHDCLVAYGMLRHARRLAVATRHTGPGTSASLGTGIGSSLPAPMASPPHHSAARSGHRGVVHQAAVSTTQQQQLQQRAVTLHQHSLVADLDGQGCLGALRAIRAGPAAKAPPPGVLVRRAFAESKASLSTPSVGPVAASGSIPVASPGGVSGYAGSHHQPQRRLAASPGMMSSVSYGGQTSGTPLSRSLTMASSVQSTRSTSGAVVVRQPPPIPEPAAMKLATVPPSVYNGLSRRPNALTIVTTRGKRQPPHTQPKGEQQQQEEEDVITMEPFLGESIRGGAGSFDAGTPSIAQREAEQQRDEVLELFDRDEHFGPNADAAAEAWAGTFRIGVMTEGRNAAPSFQSVYDVLLQQRFLWKVLRPFSICAVCHVWRCKLFIQMVRVASNVSCKWVVDVTLDPGCAFMALPRAAGVLEGLAVAYTGRPLVPRVHPGIAALVASEQAAASAEEASADPPRPVASPAAPLIPRGTQPAAPLGGTQPAATSTVAALVLPTALASSATPPLASPLASSMPLQQPPLASSLPAQQPPGPPQRSPLQQPAVGFRPLLSSNRQRTMGTASATGTPNSGGVASVPLPSPLGGGIGTSPAAAAFRPLLSSPAAAVGPPNNLPRDFAET